MRRNPNLRLHDCPDNLLKSDQLHYSGVELLPYNLNSTTMPGLIPALPMSSELGEYKRCGANSENMERSRRMFDSQDPILVLVFGLKYSKPFELFPLRSASVACEGLRNRGAYPPEVQERQDKSVSPEPGGAA